MMNATLDQWLSAIVAIVFAMGTLTWLHITTKKQDEEFLGDLFSDEKK